MARLGRSVPIQAVPARPVLSPPGPPLTLDVKDVASMLRDGGGSNLFGIESSFESDSNSDGLPDGWSTASLVVGGQVYDPPDSMVWGPAVTGGHGSRSAELVVSAATSSKKVIFSPLIAVTAGIQMQAKYGLVHNPGGISFNYWGGVVGYGSNGTTAVAHLAATSTTAGAGATTVGATDTFTVPAGVYYVRMVVGFSGLSTGTLRFDSVNLADWALGATYDFATGPTKDITADRSDVTAPTDAESHLIPGFFIWANQVLVG